MTNKEAIRILGLECDEWDISHCTASERREAFEMAITALQVQDRLQDIEYMCRLSGGTDYFRVFAALLEETNKNEQLNNLNDGVETACRVPEDDTISRQAAIDRILATGYADQIKNNLLLILRLLPSAQPLVIHCTDCEDWLERQSISGFSISELPSAQPEIIRCKDCKWHSKEYYCLTTGKFGYDDNDFCSYAERRTDE